MSSENARIKVFENWDTTLKIPSLFLLMMSMAFIRDQRLMFLLPCIAAVLFIASGVRLSILLSRFRAPLLFLLFVSTFLILFSEGETFLTAGPFALKLKGLILAINICIRVLSVIAIGVVMVNTTPLSGLSVKLKKMLIPSILVDIGIMTGRYIMVIGEDYRKMKNARKLRGYVPGGSISKRFKVIVPASATLLIRGFQQSEMVFHAMHMRGYGGDFVRRNTRNGYNGFSASGVIMFLLTVTLSVMLVILEIIID
ncbi:MAG: energy-coupling factor transporter transmembrane component T [Candidatus Fermentibacteria bacterium]|nr:energy-coupling factor transporter transmembrane component T [Candidatus Fermentibacteria bacterium]